MKQDAVLENRIPFCIGLVCGHLKSARYAEMLSWQLGIKPSELRDIDFRSKLPGLKSNEYGVTVEGIIGGKSVKKAGKPVNRLYGTNWGYGYFKYKACDYCDDVVAETADISIGDAWIPEYMNDDKGTNLVIIRNPILNDLIQAAIHKKTIAMTAIRVQDAIQSQNAGFEDRRTGLAYRLYLDELKGDWHPAKRVNARHADIPAKIKKKAESRIQLAEQSHIAFQYAVDLNSFDLFKKKMKPLLNSYNKLYPSPLWPRIWSRLKLIYQQLAK
jgi:coenzyme F420 hydrogenase subunit beta